MSPVLWSLQKIALGRSWTAAPLSHFSAPSHFRQSQPCTFCSHILVPPCTVAPSQSHYSCPSWAQPWDIRAGLLQKGAPASVREVGAHPFLPLALCIFCCPFSSICLSDQLLPGGLLSLLGLGTLFHPFIHSYPSLGLILMLAIFFFFFWLDNI